MRMPEIPCAEGYNHINQELGLVKACAWGDERNEEELVKGVLKDYLKTHPKELEVRQEQLTKEHPELTWDEVSAQAVWEIKRAVCRVSHGICPIHLEKFWEREEVRGKEVDERHKKHVQLQYAQELHG